MERGPMALFGAIVAVGLGPALWLGAQISNDDVPVRGPSTTIRQQIPAAVETDQGGSGAGEESEETVGPAVDWLPPSSAAPVTTSPSPSAGASSSPSAQVSPSAEISTEPSESVEPSASPSVPSTEPTTEESEQPPTPPTDGDEQSSAPAGDTMPWRDPQEEQ